jgi:hypothetical protein
MQIVHIDDRPFTKSVGECWWLSNSEVGLACPESYPEQREHSRKAMQGLGVPSCGVSHNVDDGDNDRFPCRLRCIVFLSHEFLSGFLGERPSFAHVNRQC